MRNLPKYWIACSGGVDSVVLVHILHQKMEHVGILHCNFHLRGESSNKDEELVRNLAKQLHLPIRVKEFDTQQYEKDHRVNTELAARELRYQWFDTIILKENKTIVLGHHYDDQIETFFLQLRRGGRVKGLSGMPVFRKGYLRPLLKHTKKDLIAIALKNNWKWREDITNASNVYMRNWYRNEIIPYLKKTGFPLTDIVSLMDSFQILLKHINQFEVPNTIRIEVWLQLPIWYQQHILSEHQLGEYPENEITLLAKGNKGKHIGNQNCSVWNEGGELVFVKEKEQLQLQLIVNTCMKNETRMNSDDLFLDAAKVQPPFNYRKWKHGDRFQPLGMEGEKKIGKFLRDRKIHTHQKENVHVLVDDMDCVLGVFGFGVDEKYKLDGNTEKVYWIGLEGKTPN